MKPHLPVGVTVSSIVQDFSDSTVLLDHAHDMAQLSFSTTGVMVVSGKDGNWVVPPTRAIWLAPHAEHRIRMLGQVRLRSIYVHGESTANIPQTTRVLAVSPLFREIIKAVTDAPAKVIPNRRTLLLTELLLEEAISRSELPLHLPVPRDHRLAVICTHIQERLDDMKPLQQWATELGCDARTLHRLFVQELGMSFVQWRHRAKLLTALEWLAEGRQILGIALDLGYQTQSAFTAMFRRNLGVAPSGFFKDAAGDTGFSPYISHVDYEHLAHGMN
jgi:AraC-like DNA-binding protein